MESGVAKRTILLGLKDENKIEALKLFSKLANRNNQQGNVGNLPALPIFDKPKKSLNMEDLMSPRSALNLSVLPILERSSPVISSSRGQPKRLGTYGGSSRESAMFSRLHIGLIDEPSFTEPGEQQLKEKLLGQIINDRVRKIITAKEKALNYQKQRKAKATIHRYNLSVEGRPRHKQRKVSTNQNL